MTNIKSVREPHAHYVMWDPERGMKRMHTSIYVCVFLYLLYRLSINIHILLSERGLFGWSSRQKTEGFSCIGIGFRLGLGSGTKKCTCDNDDDVCVCLCVCDVEGQQTKWNHINVTASMTTMWVIIDIICVWHIFCVCLMFDGPVE